MIAQFFILNTLLYNDIMKFVYVKFALRNSAKKTYTITYI